MEITIHSVIDNIDPAGLATDEPEINITTLPVTLTRCDGDVLLSYEEEQEGTKIHTDIIAHSDGAVSLDRRGGVVWCVKFRTGEESRTIYGVPPYSFDCTVKTKRAETSDTADGLKIRLVYSMNIGGSEKEVKMRITVK